MSKDYQGPLYSAHPDLKKESKLWDNVAKDLTELGDMNKNGVKWKVVPREDCDYYKLYEENDS
tara:strand:- start:1636 stop:1824 length:189 start_codon:yes stop_codon:yes gene_type:complete